MTADVQEAGSGKWKAWAIFLIAGALVVVLTIGGFLAIGLGAITSTAAALNSSESGCLPSGVNPMPSTSSTPIPRPSGLATRPTVAPTPGSTAAPAGTSTIPESLEIPRGATGKVTLDAKQLAIAASIIGVGRELSISDKGIKVALMTALQESVLKMYANSSVPESLNYPHDAVGNDHDSVNPFQQRPHWGTLAELMNLDYSIRAFYGGQSGPNGGSPRGLLDVPGWESMTPGVAAQTVQVSAYPDAYDKWEAAAELLIAELGDGIRGGACGGGGISGEMALPMDPGYQMTSGYGPRDIDVPGASTWHAAIDLQIWPDPCGDPVYAILPGEVTLSSALWLSIRHEDGFVVSYLHMYKSQRLVDVGDTVTAGQQIGVTGNVPPSGGCHLDLRINVADNTNPQVAQLMLSQNETRIRPATRPEHQNFVNPEEFMRLWGVEVCGDGCRRL